MALAHSRSRLLEIRLFGEPRFLRDAQPVHVALPPRAVLLLCVLALKAGQSVDRRKLAFTLWPDDREDEAKAKLRRHLHVLGRALCDDDTSPLRATPSAVEWNTDASCSVDVIEFERLSGEHPERAVELYAGDLLSNFYEEWLEAPRARLREMQLRNLMSLADRAAGRGEYSKSLEHARAALRIDPWREDAVRHVLTARVHAGDRSGALQEYAAFAERLREEFGAQPLPETSIVVENVKRVRPTFTNLPLETTSFIGRDAELQSLQRLLVQHRMVTVTGPGGVGKSRTALRIARALVEHYPDGVWHVDAGTPPSEEQLLHSVGMTLNLEETERVGGPEVLARQLRSKELLLVLDNAEAQLDACARLCETILTMCEHVRLLVTSRQALGTAGEQQLRLQPFEAEHDAVRLFFDRARAADASFDESEEHRTAAREICRRLDGLPLATELAAARVATLTPAEILERLGDRFDLLRRARSGGIRHHQTLHATIAWSYDLLSTNEQLLFLRLAIFPSSFTLPAAEHICAGAPLRQDGILDLFSRLVEKSLVTYVDRPERRYRLLDSLREFALNRALDESDAVALREHFVTYYEQEAQRLATQLGGSQQRQTLALLQAELDNIRGALALGARAPKSAAAALRLALSMHRFWLIRGYFSEGRKWLEQTLDSAAHVIDETTIARALTALAVLACFSDDLSAAQTCATDALHIRERTADPGGTAETMHVLGGVAYDRGDTVQALDWWRRCLELAREAGDAEQCAKTLDNLGVAYAENGDYAQAQTCLEQSLAAYRRLEDSYGLAWVIGHQARLAARRGDHGAAAALYLRSLELRETLHDQHGMANSLHYLAGCYFSLGDVEAALDAARSSIRIWHDLRYKIWLADAFENLAHLEAERAPERAATLCGAAQHLRELTGKPLPEYQRATHQAVIQTLGERLGAALPAIMEAGQALTLDQAVALALVQPVTA